MKLKKFNEALTAFKKATELSKADELTKLQEAKKQGQMGEAMRGVAAANKNDPAMLAEAEDALQKSLKLNPNFVSAHYNIMMTYKMMNRPQEAAQSYQEAQKISPERPEDWEALGKSYLENGDKKKAEFAFHSAIKDSKEEDSAEIREAIGEAYLEKGMIKEALAAFADSQKADPNSVRIYNRMGIAHRKEGNVDAAIEQYKNAVKVYPKDEAIYYTMATAYIEKGAKDDARAALTKAVNMNPDCKEAKALLGKI